MRILVVDDEPAVRASVERALRLEGYDVELAGDGREALARLASAAPDAIVLDVLMPEVDGLAVCRRLRSVGDRTPVLVLTARDAVPDRVAGRDAGADDYLVKPFALEELLARVRALIRRTAPDTDGKVGNDAVWLIANSKNGISSHELGRALGVTQKSTWFMLHRIRLAMQTGSFDRFSGEVEVDETYIGGKARNMHKRERAQKISGTGGHNKAKVLGAVERESGKVRLSVVPHVDGSTVGALVRDRVEQGSRLYTDRHHAYCGLDVDYPRETVDHAEVYVNGRVHTNRMENFWALLKRGLHGTYISVQPFHLFRYLDERVFTFNERELDDYGRFASVLRAVAGRRLTWAELTGK